MPSPVGHLLVGAAIAFAAEPALRRRPMPSVKAAVIALAVLAALPDADLAYQRIHRAVTHSIGSTIVISIVATVVTGWVTGRRSYLFGLLCGLAWGSHIVLDWLGTDPTPPRGIKALWPFSDRWFISELDVFRGTERRQVFTVASFVYNLKAVAQEVAILGPVTLILGLRIRRRGTVGRGRTSPGAGARRDGVDGADEREGSR